MSLTCSCPDPTWSLLLERNICPCAYGGTCLPVSLLFHSSPPCFNSRKIFLFLSSLIVTYTITYFFPHMVYSQQSCSPCLPPFQGCLAEGVGMSFLLLQIHQDSLSGTCKPRISPCTAFHILLAHLFAISQNTLKLGHRVWESKVFMCLSLIKHYNAA